MSVWMKNTRSSLGTRSVLILHGNVRDKYINPDNGTVYDNLTPLLTEIAGSLSISFSQIVFYDMADGERGKVSSERQETRQRKISGDPELDGELSQNNTAQEALESRGRRKKRTPAQFLVEWREPLSRTDENSFVVIFYLDRIISYKESYTNGENDILIGLEKLIENITPNNRLVLVAIRDTLVPIELYTNSPKTSVQSISMPDGRDREDYLKHRLGDHVYLKKMADLTDGLFLRDMDNIILAVADNPNISEPDLNRLINKYRVGEQEDYFGALDIEKILNAQYWFEEEEGVKNQSQAITKVRDMMVLARSGLSGLASGTPAKPKGILFFSGPTGVGKTMVAKKLAKFIFGKEESFLRFDMSEFKEEHTVSKLIGSPPGYVGFEQGGMLTNSVRERPFSVILFDEIEKAHPKIMDIFLQILDEGRLTDSRGQTVMFTETVIIFTSNLGTRSQDKPASLLKGGQDLGDMMEHKGAMDYLRNIMDDPQLNNEEKAERLRDHFIRAVESFFTYEISRPELLNRIGNNIVPFNYINTQEAQNEMFISHFRRIEERFRDIKRSDGHDLVFDDAVASWMVSRHGEKVTMLGGRGITNAIEDDLIIRLAYYVLEAEYHRQGQIKFCVQIPDGEIDISMEQAIGRV